MAQEWLHLPPTQPHSGAHHLVPDADQEAVDALIDATDVELGCSQANERDTSGLGCGNIL
jgi:hypothetical protein